MLAGGEYGEVSHDRDQPIITLTGKPLPPGPALRAHPHHRVPVFGVVIGDALDRASEGVHASKYTREVGFFR